ncbi:hypothetical protein [Vibrio phage RYC]|nr:hypothetical protein [Vibrio phage RYC]
MEIEEIENLIKSFRNLESMVGTFLGDESGCIEFDKAEIIEIESGCVVVGLKTYPTKYRRSDYEEAHILLSDLSKFMIDNNL